MEQIDKTRSLVQQIAGGKMPYEICIRPPLYRVALRDTGSTYTDDTSTQYREWQSYIPLASASLCIDMNLAEHLTGTLPVNLGFIIEKEYVDRLDCCVPPEGVELNPLLCLYTIISGSDDELDEPNRIQPAMKWIADNGYALDGQIVTQMIATFDAGDGMKRYDKAWFPIKSIAAHT